MYGQSFDGGGEVIDEQAGHSAVAADVVVFVGLAEIGAEPSRPIQSELTRDAGALKGRLGSVDDR